jgi:hypothetical protein
LQAAENWTDGAGRLQHLATGAASS